MNKMQNAQRQRTVAAAIGSVRAEGLRPSIATQKRLKNYADGKISVAEMRSATLRVVKAKTQPKK